MAHREWTHPVTGVRCPSVTEVLGQYQSKEIRAFRLRVGEAKANAVLRLAGDFGSLVHNYIDDNLDVDRLTGGDFDRERAANLADKACTWVKESNIKILRREISLFSAEDGFGGTFDAIGRRADGGKVLIDWKTSGQISPTFPLQLAAYSRLLFIESGENLDDGVILHLDKKRDVPATPYDYSGIGSKGPYWRAFKDFLILWQSDVSKLSRLKRAEAIIKSL